MKAVVQPALHHPAELREVEKPVAGPGEVIVALKAAALNHRDVFIQQGLYPRIVLPVVLGSDGAGVVAEVGAGVDRAWIGQEVVINCALNWGGDPNFYGPDFRILGMPDNGTFAEYLKIGLNYLHRKPAHLSFEEAAVLPLGGVTAWRALMTRAAFRPGDKVLITGIGGGVALLALQFAVAQAAEVWVTSGSEEKIRQAVALGARDGVNYRENDWAKDLMARTGGGRNGYFNVVVDSAGGAGFAKLIDVAAPGGRIVFYGATTGNITDIVPAKMFFKQLNIHGTTMGTEKEFAAMIRFVEQKKMKPVIDEVVGLEAAEQAMRRMEKGAQFGKIVLKIGQ